MNYATIKRLGQLLESIVGLIAVFFIGFIPSVFCLLMGLASLVNEENNREIRWWVLLSALPLVTALALWVAKMAGRAMRMSYPELAQWGERPFNGSSAPREPSVDSVDLPMPVTLAMNLPRIPLLLAPLLSLWWLSHFGGGILVSLGVDSWVEATFPHWSEVGKKGLAQAIGFPFTMALNVYLMLAVGAFTRRLTVLLRVWRWRIVIDVLVALTSFGLMIS